MDMTATGPGPKQLAKCTDAGLAFFLYQETGAKFLPVKVSIVLLTFIMSGFGTEVTSRQVRDLVVIGGKTDADLVGRPGLTHCSAYGESRKGVMSLDCSPNWWDS